MTEARVGATDHIFVVVVVVVVTSTEVRSQLRRPLNDQPLLNTL